MSSWEVCKWNTYQEDMQNIEEYFEEKIYQELRCLASPLRDLTAHAIVECMDGETEIGWELRSYFEVEDHDILALMGREKRFREFWLNKEIDYQGDFDDE